MIYDNVIWVVYKATEKYVICRTNNFKNNSTAEDSLFFKLCLSIKSTGLFLSEVNNRETIAAIETNNDTYCLQKRIEKFPL